MSGVHFDARFIRWGHHDGISRFSVGLLTELVKLMPVTALIYDERQIALLPPRVEYLKVNNPASFRELFLGKRLNRNGVQKLFSPMQITGGIGRNWKLVLTLHDLIYYRHPTPPAEFGLAIGLLWRAFHLTYWPQRLLLNQADAVATVSETTAELIREHRLTLRPLTVIENAAPTETAAAPVIKKPLARQHSRELVYMGSFIGYKGVETLIRAMGIIRDHKLLLLSPISNGRRAQLERLAQQVGAAVEFKNGVSDEEYSELLAGCKALVTASKDEGFGIPLIEAMRHGTPVVVSDIEIFREVGGAAALRFAVDDPAGLAARVLELSDEQTWSKCSQAALKEASRYSWQKSALRLKNLLDNL